MTFEDFLKGFKGDCTEVRETLSKKIKRNFTELKRKF